MKVHMGENIFKMFVTKVVVKENWQQKGMLKLGKIGKCVHILCIIMQS